MASPASAKPGTVGAPWVKASSTTSITLDWSPAAGATRYQVFYSTSYDGVMASTAASRKTSGKQTELKITGLKPRTMYCFTVRALGNGTGSRSHRHCKLTMRTNNNYALESASVATYNVCSQAGACSSTYPWSKRVGAIQQRIAEAKVHVLTTQETYGRNDDLARALAPSGFAEAVGRGSEAIYYRTSKFSVAQRTSTSGDPEPDVGSWHLGNSADAAWAHLTSLQTGTTYLFVSVHLTNGKGTAESDKRRVETAELVRQVKSQSTVDTNRVVITGDFNSHRNRADDSPRKELERNGWFDTYDRSATYTYPRHNSYSGYTSTPTTSERYGDHVDHVFVQDGVGSTGWKTVHKFTKIDGRYRYVTPLGSDHSPVRVTLYLP